MKTERTRKTIIRALIIRKMTRPRRIVVFVAAALPRVFVADQGIEKVGEYDGDSCIEWRRGL